MRRARELDDKICRYKDDLETLNRNAHPSSSLKIEVNQCYGDMGMTYTNRVEFKGDIAEMLFEVITVNLKAQVAILEKQLEAL